MYRILAFVFLVFLFAVPTLAQENTETPEPKPVIDFPAEEPPAVELPGEVTPEDDLLQAASNLLILLNATTYLAFATPFVVIATALVKRIPHYPFSAGATAFAFQVLIWVIWVLLRRWGVSEDQFKNVLGALTTILTGVGGLVATGYFSKRAYIGLERFNVPVLGYSKTPSPSVG